MGLFKKSIKNKNVFDTEGNRSTATTYNENYRLFDSVENFNDENDRFVVEESNSVYKKNAYIGRNTNLIYRNKYVSTGKRLATTDVVDVSKYEAPKPAIPVVAPVKTDIIEDSKKSEEKDDFDDFFKNLDSVKEPEEVEEPEEKPAPVVKKVSSKPRKKKRAFDIDIISGGHGGDII